MKLLFNLSVLSLSKLKYKFLYFMASIMIVITFFTMVLCNNAYHEVVIIRIFHFVDRNIFNLLFYILVQGFYFMIMIEVLTFFNKCYLKEWAIRINDNRKIFIYSYLIIFLYIVLLVLFPKIILIMLNHFNFTFILEDDFIKTIIIYSLIYFSIYHFMINDYLNNKEIIIKFIYLTIMLFSIFDLPIISMNYYLSKGNLYSLVFYGILYILSLVILKGGIKHDKNSQLK
ncbi:MAG: hypothetical protein SPI53_02660 [Erysipelotrichaceae bacterium]|nr:hypothetical protein [Erysipelotrichaceae bacterium]